MRLMIKQIDREAAYRNAQEHASKARTQLPLQLGRVVVKSFGEIDRRPKYHNRVNIFPVGYRCELAVQDASQGVAVCVECTVKDGGDDGPLFSAKIMRDFATEEVESKQLPQFYKKVRIRGYSVERERSPRSRSVDPYSHACTFCSLGNFATIRLWQQ